MRGRRRRTWKRPRNHGGANGIATSSVVKIRALLDTEDPLPEAHFVDAPVHERVESSPHANPGVGCRIGWNATSAYRDDAPVVHLEIDRVGRCIMPAHEEIPLSRRNRARSGHGETD